MFEWDGEKQRKNLEKHGLDFAVASLVFDGRSVLTAPSTNHAEERFITIGIIDGRFIAVIWTWRGDNIRIISARRARDEEKQKYNQKFQSHKN